MRGHEKYILMVLVLGLIPVTGFGQRSPGDLADISLSELLEIPVDSSVSSSDENDESSGKAPTDAIEILDSASSGSLWYRYKQVRFEGYLEGDSSLTNAEVLARYPVVPTVISQEAHIVGLNYRFSNLVDFTLTLPYVYQSTEHIRRAGAPFTLASEGLGDLALATNYAIYKHGKTAAILTLGVTAPTGSIDKKGNTPRGRGTQLPYAMQIGSGTWELHPGLTLTAPAGDWQLGATLDGAFRMGENDRDYSFGDEFSATLCANRKLGSRFQLGTFLRGECWDGLDGADREVSARIAPVADPDTYGGCKVEVGGSLRFLWKEDVYEDCYFELGGGVPIHQHLNGPQPKEQWNLSLGLSFGF